MRRIVMAVAVVVFGVQAHAGPWRPVTRSSSSTCVGGQCGTVRATTRVVARGTATAQGVAEIQAANGAVGHHGGNAGYEGVGVGPTPEAALGACCRGSGHVVDQGVCQGRDGRWYACRRYAR